MLIPFCWRNKISNISTNYVESAFFPSCFLSHYAGILGAPLEADDGEESERARQKVISYG